MFGFFCTPIYFVIHLVSRPDASEGRRFKSCYESNGKVFQIPEVGIVSFVCWFQAKNWNIYSRLGIISNRNRDNPNILSYLVNGDLTLIYAKSKSVVSFEGSHNFNLKGEMRRSDVFSWSYPIKETLKDTCIYSKAKEIHLLIM
jgi:outer membrane phospholipase A